MALKEPSLQTHLLCSYNTVQWDIEVKLHRKCVSVCLCMCVCMDTSQTHVEVREQLAGVSSSTMWDPGIDLKSSALAAGAFIQ